MDMIKLRKLCCFDNKLIKNCFDFYNRLNDEQQNWFNEQLEELFRRFKYCGVTRNHISPASIKLAIKIFDELNILCFPNIQIGTRRGWDTSGGTWAWYMEKFPIGTIGSCDPSSFCIKKHVKLSCSDQNILHHEISGDQK